jgi:hypothetical protein
MTSGQCDVSPQPVASLPLHDNSDNVWSIEPLANSESQQSVATLFSPSSSSALVSLLTPNSAGSGSDDGYDDDLEWEEWRPDQMSFLSHMIAGSMAGLAEHVTLYPIDTIKTHLQCQRCGNSITSNWSSTLNMVRKEGVFRLWRGVSAMFAGCIPGTL